MTVPGCEFSRILPGVRVGVAGGSLTSITLMSSSTDRESEGAPLSVVVMLTVYNSMDSKSNSSANSEKVKSVLCTCCKPKVGGKKEKVN